MLSLRLTKIAAPEPLLPEYESVPPEFTLIVSEGPGGAVVFTPMVYCMALVLGVAMVAPDAIVTTSPLKSCVPGKGVAGNGGFTVVPTPGVGNPGVIVPGAAPETV